MAVLFQTHLRPNISIVRTEEYARHRWIKISLQDTCQLYIGGCYFPPDTSSYESQVTTQGHSPYKTLYADIVEFSRQGDILLLGDFNARTSDRQVRLLDFDNDSVIVPELHMAELGTLRLSDDAHAPVTRYGHHLLEIGRAHV